MPSGIMMFVGALHYPLQGVEHPKSIAQADDVNPRRSQSQLEDLPRLYLTKQAEQEGARFHPAVPNQAIAKLSFFLQDGSAPRRAYKQQKFRIFLSWVSLTLHQNNPAIPQIIVSSINLRCQYMGLLDFCCSGDYGHATSLSLECRSHSSLQLSVGSSRSSCF